MAYKRIKTEDMDANFKYACRCCLKSEAEFYKLDALTESSLDDNDASSTKVPFIRLLLFCLRTENLPELPQLICVDCTKTLKISYFFIQNALKAHEILCRKLCPGKIKTSTRSNGQQQQSSLFDVSSCLRCMNICYCSYQFCFVCRELMEMTRQLARITCRSYRSLPYNTDAKYAVQSSITAWS